MAAEAAASPDGAGAPARATETWRGHALGPAVQAHGALQRSGLEFLQAIISGDLPTPPICRALNFWLSEASPGRAVFEGEPAWDHLNPLGGVHGGWPLTLIDSATGCAAQSVLDAGVGYTTVETRANMVRAIAPDSGRYVCEAEVLSHGRTIITAEAKITGPGGRLYAHGGSTLLVMRRDKPV